MPHSHNDTLCSDYDCETERRSVAQVSRLPKTHEQRLTHPSRVRLKQLLERRLSFDPALAILEWSPNPLTPANHARA